MWIIGLLSQVQGILFVLDESPQKHLDESTAGTENTDPSPPPRAEPPASQLMELTSKIQTLLQEPWLLERSLKQDWLHFQTTILALGQYYPIFSFIVKRCPIITVTSRIWWLAKSDIVHLNFVHSKDPHLNSKPSELRQLSDTLQRMVETFAPPTPTTDSTVRGRPAGAVFRNAANGARLKSRERTTLGMLLNFTINVLADFAVMSANGWWKEGDHNRLNIMSNPD